MCLFQIKTWISNVIWRDLLFCDGLMLEVIVRFVDIGGIIDHQLFFIKNVHEKQKWYYEVLIIKKPHTHMLSFFLDILR